MTPDPPPPPATWSGLMAGFAPAPTDRSTTNSGDTGGPVGPGTYPGATAGLLLVALVAASSSIACVTATASARFGPPPRTPCADGLPVRILQDPACAPDGICGYSCVPNRWKGPPC